MKTIYYCHDKQNDPQVRRHELETVGYHVQLFDSGGALVRAIARELPALVLMDVLLDGANGFEVCAGLDLRTRKELAVILFAGVYTRPAYRDEALELGVEAFVDSEIPHPELIAEISKAIAARRGNDQEPLAA